MGLTDKSLSFSLPYKKETVQEAVNSTINQMKGFKIKSSNKLTGVISIQTGVSATSWGENITLSLDEISDNKTQITVTSSSKTGILAGGAFTPKNQANIDLIVNNIGAYLEGKSIKSKSGSEKSALVTVLLIIFLGYFGVHRFYLGKTKTGVLYLFTLGLLGLGVIIDFFRLIIGNLTDKNGNPVINW
ncbi:MAG: TM2 domain-containing protein [Crocinitomicaceae bacterium]|nr:TM2 domain-containing protein [Crocinitomicaceae bacterium]